jgi:prepilin peptidase CpaA
MVTDGLLIGAVALLVYAALHDLAARTVPNWLPLCLLVIGLAVRLADHSLWPALLVALAAFLILFVIWVCGLMGGGDVKLWAATVLLIPPHWQPQLNFCLLVLLIGGALGLVYLALWWPVSRLRRNLPAPAPAPRPGLFNRALAAEIWRISRRGPLPYALAIAASAIITLLPVPLQH